MLPGVEDAPPDLAVLVFLAVVVAMVDGESLTFFRGGQVQSILNGPYSFLGPDAPGAVRSFLVGQDDGIVRQHQWQGTGYSVTWTRDFGATSVEGVSVCKHSLMPTVFRSNLVLPAIAAHTLVWKRKTCRPMAL